MRTLVVILSALLVAPTLAERIWWDGSTDDEDAPPGKLLSDNEGWWGETVLTGVEYTYDVEPTNPADIWRTDAERYGRRLLDGRPEGNWWVPVGVNHQALVVTFDFQRLCSFAEVDVCTRSKQVAVTIETGDDPGGPWTEALTLAREDCPEQAFHRLPIDESGRYLRLSLDSGGISWVDEVLVWGDAQGDAAEAYNPVAPVSYPTGTAFTSISGADKTAFSDAQFWDWQRDLGERVDDDAVWSRVPTYDSISAEPILPASDALASRVELVMARNETECAALALTNTSIVESREVEVSLPDFEAAGMSADLRVAGVIGSRQFGVNIGPLFSADNLLGPSLMHRYLTNAECVEGFPRLVVPPGGSAVLWLSVTSDRARPGAYRATLAATGCDPVQVQARVMDVTLPDVDIWLNTWSDVTSQFPFTYGERDEREVAYKQSLGVTVWDGFPEEGSVSALARQRGRTIHHVYGLPREYVDKGYANQIAPDGLTDDDRAAITEHVLSLVADAEALGLDYDDWYAELWDEPGERNSELYGAMARVIREADPRARICCNPCFWEGDGVLDDDAVSTVLESWYNETIDISVPLFLLLRDRPKCWDLFAASRSVRAFYTVSTQSAKGGASDQVELYRRQAWDAARRGWNGWGFYSYYAPRGNPWTDFDGSWLEDRPDYQMVYPGPRGPIPTRPSEAVREGWEEYQLIELLRRQGKRKRVDDILADYESGKSMDELRTRALRVAQ
ncbi:MAG TPA: hypothetical protein QGH10_23595 [Armatimonadota bacterium]|nr:hypothetical protein [Armatimonadota bacterium]